MLFLIMHASTAAMDSSDSQNILSENKVMNYQSDNGFVADYASCGVDGESCRSVAKKRKTECLESSRKKYPSTTTNLPRLNAKMG